MGGAVLVARLWTALSEAAGLSALATALTAVGLLAMVAVWAEAAGRARTEAAASRPHRSSHSAATAMASTFATG